MTHEVPESYLFRGIGQEYEENRRQFEARRSSEAYQNLFDRVRVIVQRGTGTSDNIQAISGTRVEADKITLTVGAFKYGDQLRPGEQALTKQTDWLPYDECEINGITVSRSVKFESTDFTREGTRKPGFLEIQVKYTDSEGVTAETTIAKLDDRTAGRAELIYSFGNQIPYASDDYKEVVKMIESAEQQLGIEVGQS